MQRYHDTDFKIPQLLNASDKHFRLATAVIFAYGSATFGVYPPESLPHNLYIFVQHLARWTAMASQVNADDLHAICQRGGIFRECRNHCRHCRNKLIAPGRGGASYDSVEDEELFLETEEIVAKTKKLW